jgi:hypothetical protein
MPVGFSYDLFGSFQIAFGGLVFGAGVLHSDAIKDGEFHICCCQPVSEAWPTHHIEARLAPGVLCTLGT